VDEPDGPQQRVLGREPGQRPDLVEAENLALVNRNRDLVHDLDDDLRHQR
jgi:hypothetical protein